MTTMTSSAREVLEQLIPKGRLGQLLEAWATRRVRRWRGLKVGEFLLGYENEDGALPTDPRPARTRRDLHGVSQAEQDVRGGRFREHTERCAGDSASVLSVCGRGSSAAGAMARRSRSRPSTPTPTSRSIAGGRTRSSTGRPERRPLPARRPRSSHEPARRATRRRVGNDAPSHHPARHALRRRVRPGERGRRPRPGLRLPELEHRARIRDDPGGVVRGRVAARVGKGARLSASAARPPTGR